MRYYAIEISNNGSHLLKKVISHNLTLPVDGIAYKTIEDAQVTADKLGITIEKVGTCWEIL